MTLKKIVKCRLCAAIAALLTIVPLGTVSAQKTLSTTTKKASPQQQSCAAKCEAQVQDAIADNQEYDLGYTPEELNDLRRKCMSYCPGQPAARLGNAPGQATQGSSCGNIVVGTWEWFNGDVHVFSPGGTMRGPGVTGNWTCKNRALVLSWSNGYVDHLTLSSNGPHLYLSGKNQFGMTVTGTHR